MTNKHNLLYYLRPVTWFAERWFVLSLVWIATEYMFNIAFLLGIITGTMGITYFLHRYIAWDLIEQWFTKDEEKEWF